ncbi:hypothetical protein [Dactylosporangium sp. NPDC005555]|uniref:hypothetical protein n=1 Tax=Dactylosporangium sp. NPDC005555 TaxID=3154889 RepID=UPI00339F3165
MTTGEPRTYRNWQAIAYYGTGFVGFALVGFFAFPPLWYASIPCGLLLLAATRQHVIVHATEVELHNVVRQRRIPLAQLHHLGVLYSRGWHFGWRIRLHHADTHTDTFAFLNLAGFRLLDAGFAAPPADAPAPVKELFGLLSARAS